MEEQKISQEVQQQPTESLPSNQEAPSQDQLEKKGLTSVLDEPNSKLGSFTFLASSGVRNEGSYFCNDFVGLPSVPLLGQYGKMGYEINDVKMLSIHECEVKEGKIFTSSSSEEIVLPEKLTQLISKVPKDILNNKPILYDDDMYSMLPPWVDNKPYVPEFNTFDYPETTAFNFAWAVSFQDDNINSETLPMPMNLVLHPFIYPIIDLMGKKRICCDVPACAFPAELQPGMKKWEKDFRSISLGELRGEFLSVHMKGGASLCFSPNNLKFQMDPSADITHFYSFVLAVDGFYIVTYHWNVNNPKLFKLINQIFETSKNTREIIENLTKVLGEKSPYIQTLYSIYQSSLNPKKAE